MAVDDGVCFYTVFHLVLNSLLNVPERVYKALVNQIRKVVASSLAKIGDITMALMINPSAFIHSLSQSMQATIASNGTLWATFT